MIEKLTERPSVMQDSLLMKMFVGVVLAAIVAGTALLLELRQTSGITQEKVTQLEDRLADFKNFMSDRYTGSQARHDLSRVEQVLERYEEEFDRLRARIITLEVKQTAPK